MYIAKKLSKRSKLFKNIKNLGKIRLIRIRNTTKETFFINLIDFIRKQSFVHRNYSYLPD